MDIFGSIFGWLQDQLNNILSWVVLLLPPSPFSLLDMTPLHDYLGYINYFVPLDYITSLLSAWGLAILTYYIYHIILRWVKAIN